MEDRMRALEAAAREVMEDGSWEARERLRILLDGGDVREPTLAECIEALEEWRGKCYTPGGILHDAAGECIDQLRALRSTAAPPSAAAQLLARADEEERHAKDAHRAHMYETYRRHEYAAEVLRAEAASLSATPAPADHGGRGKGGG